MKKNPRRDLLWKRIRNEVHGWVARTHYSYDGRAVKTDADYGDKWIPVWIPVTFSFLDFKNGYYNLRESDFTSKTGYASLNEDGTYYLHVHSNHSISLKPVSEEEYIKWEKDIGVEV